MQLIGMLDSPYVRRVAISMKRMGLPFEHRSISVFRRLPEFQKINPLVKAPTLVCDDGEILMDSTLIIDYLESLVAPDKRLMPAGATARRDALDLPRYPALVAYSARAEALPEFVSTPLE